MTQFHAYRVVHKHRHGESISRREPITSGAVMRRSGAKAYSYALYHGFEPVRTKRPTFTWRRWTSTAIQYFTMDPNQAGQVTGYNIYKFYANGTLDLSEPM